MGGYQPPSLARWLTLAAGVIGSAASSGIIATVIFGMTLKQIALDLGWYRSQVSIALVCFYAFNGVGALLLGHLATRHGVRWPAVMFVAMFAGTLFLVALLPASLALFIVTFILLGLGSGGCTSMPFAIGIAGWFDRGRGLALAIAVSGTGLGHIIVPSYAQWLLAHDGWRGVYMGVSAYVALFGLSALLLLYREPPIQKANRNGRSVSFMRIYRDSKEIRSIAIAIFLFSFASIGLSVSLPSIMTDLGFSTRDAAMIFTLYGAATWIAKLGTGLLLDRYHVRYVAAAIFIATSTAAILLIASPTLLFCYVAAGLIGMGVGAEADIMTFAASRYYEPRLVAKAIGAVWVLLPWGAGLGVMAGSMSFDLVGGYGLALALYGICAALAGVVVARLGPYKDHTVIALASGPERERAGQACADPA